MTRTTQLRRTGSLRRISRKKALRDIANLKPLRKSPLASKGAKAKRNKPLDDVAREACFAKFGRRCLLCREAEYRNEFIGGVTCSPYEDRHPHWAHFYTRGPGAHLRHHPLGALPLGATHHRWQTDNPKAGLAAMLACLTETERAELEAAKRGERNT